MMNFGQRLKHAREAAGLLQTFVASEIVMDQANLSKLENGKAGLPERETLERLSKVPGLNISLLTLLAWRILEEYPPEAIRAAFEAAYPELADCLQKSPQQD